MSTRPPARTWGPSHQTDGPVRPHRPLWARIAISVLSSMFVVGFPVLLLLFLLLLLLFKFYEKKFYWKIQKIKKFYFLR